MISDTTDVLDLLGIELNLREGTIGPGKTVRAALMRSLETANEARTPRMWLQAVGTIFYPNYVYGRIALATFPHMMNALRGACRLAMSSGSMDVGWTPDSDAVKEAKQAATELLESVAFERQTPSAGRVVWSDASTTALAAVCEDEWRRWDYCFPQTRIFVAELLAAALGAKVWRADALILDNQAAVYAIRRGHSANAAGDRVIRYIIDQTTATHVAWVSTDIQRADPLTRGEDSPAPNRRPPATYRVRWRRRGE